jgi:hypothetical protein
MDLFDGIDFRVFLWVAVGITVFLFLVVFPLIRKKWIKGILIGFYVLLLAGLYIAANPAILTTTVDIADLEDDYLYAVTIGDRVYIIDQDAEENLTFTEYREIMGFWVSFGKQATKYAFFGQTELGQVFCTMYRYDLPDGSNVVYLQVSMIYIAVGEPVAEIIFEDDEISIDSIVVDYVGYHYLGRIGALGDDSSFTIMGFPAPFDQMVPLT